MESLDDEAPTELEVGVNPLEGYSTIHAAQAYSVHNSTLRARHHFHFSIGFPQHLRMTRRQFWLADEPVLIRIHLLEHRP